MKKKSSGVDDIKRYAGIHPDYSEEIEYFKQEKIYSIQIEVNLSCDQGCIYCYATPENSSIREMPKKDVITIIDSAAAMEVRAIDWLGGDPLLRKDWHELMQYAHEKGLVNNIWTSGIPLKTMEVARKAVELTKGGFISVHLDTLDEKIYTQLHSGNATTNIEAILKGVENVQQLGKYPNHMINCITFTKPLRNDVEKTIRYFFENKGMRTCLTQMCPEGLAKNKQHLLPSQEDIQKACIIRDSINYPNSKESIATMDVNKFYCGGMVCITIDGDVTPCSVIRKGFGNIHTSSLEQIIEQNRNELLFLHLRKIENLPGHCSACENNSVCWGCRALAYTRSGNMYDEDPNCYKKPYKLT
jgi:radical SAM protein with 4Fe4S-binding SPASM domain